MWLFATDWPCPSFFRFTPNMRHSRGNVGFPPILCLLDTQLRAYRHGGVLVANDPRRTFFIFQSCRKFAHNAVQLHALAYNLGNFLRTLALAGRRRALVADDAQGQTDQDWRQDRSARALRHLPDDGGRRSSRPVRRPSCAASTGSDQRRCRHDRRLTLFASPSMRLVRLEGPCSPIS